MSCDYSSHSGEKIVWIVWIYLQYIYIFFLNLKFWFDAKFCDFTSMRPLGPLNSISHDENRENQSYFWLNLKVSVKKSTEKFRHFDGIFKKYSQYSFEFGKYLFHLIWDYIIYLRFYYLFRIFMLEMISIFSDENLLFGVNMDRYKTLLAKFILFNMLPSDLVVFCRTIYNGHNKHGLVWMQCFTSALLRM